MRQMQDFDTHTNTISESDPVKREALERGNLRDYWATALAFWTKFVHTFEAAQKAANKQPVPSRPIRKARARG